MTEESRRMMDYAQSRAAEWGAVMRHVFNRCAPNANCYSLSPYLAERVGGDWNDTAQGQEAEEREVRAFVVDSYYQSLTESLPLAAQAMFIAFVRTHPSSDEKVDEWKRETKRSRHAYYESRRMALDGLGLYLRTMVDE